MDSSEYKRGVSMVMMMHDLHASVDNTYMVFCGEGSWAAQFPKQESCNHGSFSSIYFQYLALGDLMTLWPSG